MADETVKETKAPEMTEEEIVGQLPDMQLAQLRFELGCSDSVCTNKAELKQQLVDAGRRITELGEVCLHQRVNHVDPV